MATNAVNTILKEEWLFRSGVYDPTGTNALTDGSATPVNLTLDEGGTGLSAGAAVNSDQIDLGATRPEWIDVKAALEWFASVPAGDVVSMYWSGSANSNAAAGNPGQPDGVDGLYSGDGSTVEEAVRQMQFIGNFISNGKTGVQIAYVGGFPPRYRYGQIIVFNETATLLCGNNDVESAVLFYGTIPDIAAAA